MKNTHHPSDYIVEEILEHPEVSQSSGLSEDKVREIEEYVKKHRVD